MSKSNSSKTNDDLDSLMTRAKELSKDSLDFNQAIGKAWQEKKLKYWPKEWGDDLHVIIYGDFREPPKVIDIPALGITILPEKKEKTIIRNARCSLEAIVKIDDKSQAALLDATRRLNVLLGSWSLITWGNGYIGWWSWMTNETSGGILNSLDADGLEEAISSILNLPEKIRKKIDAALFWIRASKHSFYDGYRNDIFHIYAGYWNAFECLVEAVCLLHPKARTTKAQKNEMIDQYFSGINRSVTWLDIEKCYKEIVNPGFVGKASYALHVCFGEQGGNLYENECFKIKPKNHRLYYIRNAINHGDFDAENIDELLMIQSRVGKLFIIVWGIFGRLVKFSFPLDDDLNLKSH